MIFNIYKKRGETPLECIQNFRKNLLSQGSIDKADDKWTYLGRLDPMADGVLLAATGKDIEKRNEFLELDKEYEFTALLGFSTDTYDILGKILRVEKLNQVNEMDLIKLSTAYEGEREQKYPPYSSKTVNGKALHEWSRKGVIDEIDVPSKNIKIYKMQFLSLSSLSPKELLGRLLMDISKVKGDFRQHDILALWKLMLSGFKQNGEEAADKIFLAKFRAEVSSGTYIRGLVNDLGNTLSTGACALSITRTKLGEYKIEDSLK